MAGKLNVEIVSPDGSVFKGEAKELRAPGVNGSFQILKDHAPMIALLDVGPIYLTRADGKSFAFATSGGFVEVVGNYVTILAESAEPASAIDVERAKESEARALAALKNAGSAEREQAERDLKRARNRLRMSMGSVGSDA